MKRHLRRELYQPPRRIAEQELRNQSAEGRGLDETSWLAPGVSPSYRTYSFLREGHKPNSPARVGFGSRGVFGRRSIIVTTPNYMHKPRGASSHQLDLYFDNDLHHRLFDAFDGSENPPSNEKMGDGREVLTRLTDLTVSEMGVYVSSAHPHPRPHPLGLLPAPLTTTVKPVKSVKPHDGEGWFSPTCRQTRCQFDGSGTSGVFA